jgi:hypothetical protein
MFNKLKTNNMITITPDSEINDLDLLIKELNIDLIRQKAFLIKYKLYQRFSPRSIESIILPEFTNFGPVSFYLNYVNDSRELYQEDNIRVDDQYGKKADIIDIFNRDNGIYNFNTDQLIESIYQRRFTNNDINTIVEEYATNAIREIREQQPHRVSQGRTSIDQTVTTIYMIHNAHTFMKLITIVDLIPLVKQCVICSILVNVMVILLI